MKAFSRLALLGSLLVAPVFALAAVPGNWTGPHVGVLLGGNSVSSENTGTELAFTATFLAGYDFQLVRHFVIGVGGFYEWNNQKSHTFDNCVGSCSVRYGSRIYGVDTRFGFPLGQGNIFMPYVKVGYGWYNLSGDLSHSDSSMRYGIGFEWMSETGRVSLLVQYTHQKLDVPASLNVGNITNNNFTIGANFFF